MPMDRADVVSTRAVADAEDNVNTGLSKAKLPCGEVQGTSWSLSVTSYTRKQCFLQISE